MNVSAEPQPLGRLFPIGGPVPPDLIVGRTGEIEGVEQRLREGLSTMLMGPRRIGKTTVCGAICDRLDDEMLVVDIEVPERPDSRAFLQEVVDRCSRISLAESAQSLFRVLRPTVERVLSDQGVPLDLSTWGSRDGSPPSRAVLAAPLEMARKRGQRLLFFLDELQRAADYADGADLLRDIVDLYGGLPDAVVLVDGSDERTLERLLGGPAHLGKLVDRIDLEPRIAPAIWRPALTDRFARAGLHLSDAQRDALLDWSDGRPYETMAVSRATAFSARRTGTTEITDFDVRMGIDEATRRLDDDDV